MPAPPRGEGLERNLTVFCSLADVPAHKATRKLDAVDGGVGVCAGVGKRGTLTQHAEHAAARGAVGAVGMHGAGVEDALRKIGAQEGDTVTIGDISFDWEPSRGGDPTLAGRGQDARLGGTTRASAEERKRASQARRGLIDEYDYGTGEAADRERWQG